MSITEIDQFLTVVAQEILEQLDHVESSAENPSHWLVASYSDRLETLEIKNGEPHDLLASSIEDGAVAAAYVTHVPGFNEHILASVLVADPRNSDIRRSSISRSGDELRLHQWEYVV